MAAGSVIAKTTAERQRGGAGRGQGRKPIKAGEETVTTSIRLTVSQRAKLERLGGAQWLRDRIDRARAPARKEAT